FVRRVQVPARLGKDRWHVAGRAARSPVEDGCSTLGRGPIERSIRGGRRRDRELVEVQRRQLRRNEIGIAARVAEAGAGSDGVLLGVVEAWIVERALTVHLEVRN